MKKLLAVSIVIFSLFMSYVVVGGFLQKQQKESASETTPAATTPAPATSTTSGKSFSSSEVATHASTTDCWLIINNTVYDVTTFLAEHPGGAAVIIPYCGKEATRAFDTQDRGSRGGHSSNASSMLATYKIGTLK
jgi:cytochrome b involved in lipid metabolism